MSPDLTTEELLSALADLPLQDQAKVVEEFVAARPLTAAVADMVALCLMSVRLGMDASWPDDMRGRIESLTDKVAAFNAVRFANS
jgi:hypothetical protein